jgi:hypothetical protein
MRRSRGYEEKSDIARELLTDNCIKRTVTQGMVGFKKACAQQRF